MSASWWQVVVAVAAGAILSLLVARFAGRRWHPPKRLDWILVSDERIPTAKLASAPAAAGELKVLWAGKELRDPRLVTVRIQNTGKQGISVEDFDNRPIRATSVNGQFLSATILKARSPALADEAASWENRQLSGAQTAEFSPVLFNERDWIEVQFLLEGGGPLSLSVRFTGQTDDMRQVRAELEVKALWAELPAATRSRLVLGGAVAVIIALVLATGPPWWFKSLSSQPSASIAALQGGCKSFDVYAQNRWAPVGAEVRAQPNVLSAGIESFAPNEIISVNGWVNGRAPYPTNVAPFNSGVWYHLTDGAGWVSFAGTRAVPTTFDPTGQASGGPPAPTLPRCKGAVQ
jgi:hypothetical protein